MHILLDGSSIVLDMGDDAVDGTRAKLAAMERGIRDAEAASKGKEAAGGAKMKLFMSTLAGKTIMADVAPDSADDLRKKLQEMSEAVQMAQEMLQEKLTFELSTFKQIHSATASPRMYFELFPALHTFVHAACAKEGIPKVEVDDFYGNLERETVEVLKIGGAYSQVQAVATRIWTSDSTVRGREFCSFLNAAIRNDDPELLPSAVAITRAINGMCVQGRKDKDAVEWPEDSRTFRGGGLPDAHQKFFVVGKKYHIPMLLSTSSEIKKAKNFARKAQHASNLPPVIYTVHLDGKEHCVHVNYLGDMLTAVKGEHEFLFTPSSTFTVRAVRWKAFPTWLDPHEVEILAAVDNKLESDDLPLAKWH